jgi:quercetin dioxygenase-like cupin family protein
MRKEYSTMIAEKPSTAFAQRANLSNSVWYVGNLFTFLATPDKTQEGFALMEITARKGMEPPRHIHDREDEAFYLMEGAATFYVGAEVYSAQPGTFVYLPRHVPHSFTFETDVVKMLALLTPGVSDGHFRDPRFSEPAQALTLPPLPEEMPDESAFIADLLGYGAEVVGPPGAPLEMELLAVAA